MRLILGRVVEATADHCLVRLPGEPEPRAAGYTEPFRPRADSIGPDCLVALDVTVEPPLVAWRWFPATVLAVEAGADDQERATVVLPQIEELYVRQGWT